ncbi:ethA [Symbiodinium microadriaticum]|nr:ethA [Symbiodinium microadriaticum]
MAKMLLAYLPQSMAHFVNRWRNILFANFFYQVCKLCPQLMKREIKRGVSHFLGKDYPVDEHFSPTYNPWDQRFCVAPGGDFFKAIKSGKASVETARIVSFTETGIEVERIANGEKKLLECDAIVTATGLVVKTAGGIEIVVDGEPVRRMDNRFMYKGCMVSGVPNFILSVGYTNMTFTLKVDLIGTYVTRLLAHMDKKGCKKCVPVYGNREGESPDDRGEDLIDLSAGYIQRAIGQFPRQGKRSPWRYYQNYFYDIWEFNYGRLEDGVMKIE